MIIGIDFDNTIVSYDQLMHQVAKERNLIEEVLCQKQQIRDTIRRQPGGELEWRRIQADVYGPLIGKANLMEGVGQFLKSCQPFGVKVFIISHKTEFATADEAGNNLRQAAMEWMTERNFFSNEGFGFTSNDIYFESTRHAKVERIARTGCTHFIDDLLETFLEPGWPASVCRILYSPHSEENTMPGVKVCSTWKEIEHYLFGLKKDFINRVAI